MSAQPIEHLEFVLIIRLSGWLQCIAHVYIHIELISEKNSVNLAVLHAIVMGLALIDFLRKCVCYA